jgi:hypothetical protein
MKTTPKDFFLHIGIMAALYVSVISLLNLVFTIVNVAFPDTELVRSSYYYADNAISWPVAALIVVFPLYLLLSWLARKDFKVLPENRESLVRRWLLVLTLFVAGGVVAGDLIFLLYKFLNGEELTIAFLLKVLSVFVLSAAVFAYYLSDLRYFIPASRNRLYALAALLVVIVMIGIGFSVIGSPMTQRLLRLDGQKTEDLQSLQSQITYHWQRVSVLPTTLDELNDELSGVRIPVDPQSKENYEYRKVSTTSFELCANFNLPSRSIQNNSITKPIMIDDGVIDSNFPHEAGRTCFTRTIDPARYPPIKY